jgi:hypothetical protein
MALYKHSTLPVYAYDMEHAARMSHAAIHAWYYFQASLVRNTLHIRLSAYPTPIISTPSCFLLSAFLTPSLGERVVCVCARVFARTPRRHTHTHTRVHTRTHSLTHVYHTHPPTNPPTHPPTPTRSHTNPHTPCGQWGPSRRGV